jgi:hypothetical protein
MAEAKQIGFTYQELAELMVRQAGIKEGLWGIYMRFGIAGANVGQSPDDVSPAAIVPVVEIGLQRFEEPSRLTVDAAEVAKAAASRPDKPTRKAVRVKP